MPPAGKMNPKLEIPVSASVRDARDVEFRLLYDEPLEKDGEYGAYYMYAVEHDGQQKTLFATVGLYRAIEKSGATKDSVVSVVRFGKQKDTRWDVALVKAGQPREARGEPAGDSRPGGGGRGPSRPSGGFKEDAARYWTAFDYAVETIKLKGIEPSVDANAVAFVFYKLLTDHGLETFPGESPEAEPEDDAAKDETNQKMRATLEATFLETGLDRGMWLPLLNALRSEGEDEYEVWADVTPESGRAAWAWAGAVKGNDKTWAEVLAELEVVGEEVLPF